MTTQDEPNGTLQRKAAVQSKISCIFDTAFNNQYKTVMATDTIHRSLMATLSNAVTIRPTVKFDGTCCLIRDDKLWKRYDRKLNKEGERKNKIFQKQLANIGPDQTPKDILQFNVET